MPKINKVYPSFYNGESEQADELILDNQCKKMVNCIPSIIQGVRRRMGTESVVDLNEIGLAGQKFHSYDRGEGTEEYVFYKTSNPSDPLRVFDKSGVEKTVSYVDVATANAYLGTVSNLKALTVQDRTFILSKDKTVGQGTVVAENPYYDKEAYYWLKRSSNDSTNVYRYAVYINDFTFSTTDKDADTAATELNDKINLDYSTTGNLPDYIRSAVIGTILKIYIAKIHAPGFRIKSGFTDATLVTPKTSVNNFVRVKDPDGNVVGMDVTDYAVSDNLINNGWQLWCDIGGTTAYYDLVVEAPTTIGVPYYNNASQAVSNTSPDFVYMALYVEDLSTLDFTFASWDSWGSQASEGWKGSIGKLTDLPNDMTFDNVFVNINGDDRNDFNDYFVKWTGSSWTEWIDPKDTRGTFSNMPIRVDRLSDGTFEVDVMDWEIPNVGSVDTNPNPSFVGDKISDVFFYKNRLGFASGDNVILSETGGYYNFYIKTVLNVLDSDPIDVAIASNQASKIYHVKPFQRGLFIFTADNQFELVSEGALSPITVAIVPVSSYAMDVNVEPVVSGTSLYFVSKAGNNKSQLREYLKDEDSLVSKGIDTTLGVPNLLPTITKLYLNSTLGYIFCYSSSTKDTLYVFKVENSGTERVQQAWFRFEFGFDIENMYLFDTSIYLLKEDVADTRILKLPILPEDGTKEDIVDALSTTQGFSSYYVLPRWMPKFSNIRNPLDNIQIKRASIYGSGTFDVDILRKGYNVTISRTYSSGSLKDMNASILGRSDDVEITIKSNGTADFKVESMTLEGLYTQSSKEVQ